MKSEAEIRARMAEIMHRPLSAKERSSLAIGLTELLRDAARVGELEWVLNEN